MRNGGIMKAGSGEGGMGDSDEGGGREGRESCKNREERGQERGAERLRRQIELDRLWKTV